jgi:Protein kinase domain
MNKVDILEISKKIDSLDLISTINDLVSSLKSSLSLPADNPIIKSLKNKSRLLVLRSLLSLKDVQSLESLKQLSITLEAMALLEKKNYKNTIWINLINDTLAKLILDQDNDLDLILEIIELSNELSGVNANKVIDQYQTLKESEVEIKCIEYSDIKFEPKAIHSKIKELSIDIFRGEYLGLPVIIKKYSGTLINENLMKCYKEAKFLQILSGKNYCFLNFYGVYKNLDSFGIVMENCFFTLEDEIQKREKNNFFYSLDEFIDIALDILEGLRYLEIEGICHRDIKPSNLFLSNNRIKIGDFSISEHHSLLFKPSSKVPGSQYYLAPELKDHNLGLSNNQYDRQSFSYYRSDLFSLAITFHDLIFFSKLYEINLIKKNIQKLKPSWLRDLILSMLNENNNSRPSFSNCIEIIKKNRK